MEAKRTRALLKEIKRRHPGAFVYKINDRTRSGIPDTVLCSEGAHVWIEFKELRIKSVPTGAQVASALTEIQRLTITQMVANAMDVFIVVFVGPTHYVFRYRRTSPCDGSTPGHACTMINYREGVYELLEELWR